MTTRLISDREMQFYLLRGRRLRAQAMHNGIAELGGRLGRLSTIFGAAAGRATAAYRRRRLRRRAIAELNALSNHELKDIGVRREEIPFLVEDCLGAKKADPVGIPAPPVPFPETRRCYSDDLPVAA